MLLISYLLKRKKEIFLLNFTIHRHNEGFVTLCTTMDLQCCNILDGIVVTVYYYWISMETTSSVEEVS